MTKLKDPLDVLINAVTSKLGFHCVDEIDGVATFGVGHYNELPQDAFDEYGRVKAKGYVDLKVGDVASLAQEGLISNVSVDESGVVEHDENGMHLTPEAITIYVLGRFFDQLDERLAYRCRSHVIGGVWDTAIREAMLVVETRLRDLSGSTNWGTDLVNECFGQKGVLASKFESDSKRQGFRDLFAGVMAVIRNDYAHNFRSPDVQETLAVIRLANLLLSKLDTLK